ncbi:MAG: xanthine dehydrogenase family protein [Bradyrhizobiaceae bacterium]|nr:xanthine dehydrogenase family protein [Bradyrhizobiaceae bacterium]
MTHFARDRRHPGPGRLVGRSLRRVEDPALVTGQGRFTGDLPAAKWVRFVRSPVAAGRILRLTAPPGVVLLTAADVASLRPIMPMLRKFRYAPIAQPILARDVVRFAGEPVGAVVADSREAAEDAAESVAVEIEGATPLVTAGAALAAGAPALHAEAPGNVIVEARIKTAAFAAAAAGAARHIKAAVRSSRQNASPMEPRAAHAVYDKASGRITLTCTTQMPHLMRTAIADAIGMAESKLRVIAPDVGGGFGQKMSLGPELILVTWLAQRLRTSVAWTEDRRENLTASFHARDIAITVDGAFDASGRLVAVAGDVVCNVGAYSCYPTTSGVEPLMAMAELPGPYDVQEYSCHARGVATNTCPMAPYRGVSRPVIAMAMERLMDKAAAAFAIDPIEIRRRNLIRRFPYLSPTGITLDEASHVETMETAAVAADVPAFRKRQAAERATGRYLGLGIATFAERTGYGSPAFAARGMDVTPGYETVDLAMDPSGFVEARIGASPHGQGLATALSQIIADELGIDPDRIRVVHGDTDRTPYGFGTFASRSLVIAGGATLLAARKIGTRLRTMAAHLLEAAPADIVLENGAARVAGTDREVAIAAVARMAYHQAHRFGSLGSNLAPGLAESATYDPPGTFSNACHIAVVAVDVDTGNVTPERLLVAEDAGILINPMIADGQIHGGVAQGVASALLEEIVHDEQGCALTATLADYLLPRARDLPAIEIRHLQTVSDAFTVTGAKGLGEGGAIGMPAAILNAINDALSPFDASIEELPATPQRIRAALRAAAPGALRTVK